MTEDSNKKNIIKKKYTLNQLKDLDIKDLKEINENSRTMARKTVEDYKKFAIKGNMIDLAIGVVIR